jgi:hypothetical protein
MYQKKVNIFLFFKEVERMSKITGQLVALLDVPKAVKSIAHNQALQTALKRIATEVRGKNPAK